MNDKIKSITGLSLAGLFALIALQGKPFLEALAGFPGLLRAWSSSLPLGAWSFILALGVGMGAWSFAIHYLPHDKNDKPAKFMADTVSIGVGVVVVLSQSWGRPAGEVLNSMWVGLLAGLAAPYLANGLRALFTDGPKP